MSIASDSISPTPSETIANRVRKRHRDVRPSSGTEEELAPLSEFVGILPLNSYADSSVNQSTMWRPIPAAAPFHQETEVDCQVECVILGRGGRSFLCNQCPFEASELGTVFRHLFASHVFRCGRCNFYCTSRWTLRRHEQMKHNAFVGHDGQLDPLSLRPDPTGDGFVLVDYKSAETVARLASSRTPRLMNGIAGFVPSSIVTPISVKQQPSPCWKPFERFGLSTPSNSFRACQPVVPIKTQPSYSDSDKHGLAFKCLRCDYTCTQMEQIRIHCRGLAEAAYLCNGRCHFGSAQETDVQTHCITCPFVDAGSNVSPGGYANTNRYEVEKFFSAYDPRENDSSVECEELRWKPMQINPDAELIKQIQKSGTFILKRSNQEENFYSLIEQMNTYGAMTAEKLYPQPSVKNTRRKLPLIIRAVGLTVRSNRPAITSREAALAEFIEAGHQFILSSEEVPDLSCPTEQSADVVCAPTTDDRSTNQAACDDVIILEED